MHTFIIKQRPTLSTNKLRERVADSHNDTTAETCKWSNFSANIVISIDCNFQHLLQNSRPVTILKHYVSSFVMFSLQCTLNEWNLTPDHWLFCHTHTQQTALLMEVKVHILYDEEPGSAWAIIPASPCSHWNIFYPPPLTHTHTHKRANRFMHIHIQCHATPLVPLVLLLKTSWSPFQSLIGLSAFVSNDFGSDKAMKQGILVNSNQLSGTADFLQDKKQQEKQLFPSECFYQKHVSFGQKKVDNVIWCHAEGRGTLGSIQFIYHRDMRQVQNCKIFNHKLENQTFKGCMIKICEGQFNKCLNSRVRLEQEVITSFWRDLNQTQFHYRDLQRDRNTLENQP